MTRVRCRKIFAFEFVGTLVGVTPSLMGHSIGRWEGDTMVIDTVAFTPHRFGVLTFPSGPNKHLVERLSSEHAA